MHDIIKYDNNEIMLDRVDSRNEESPHRCPPPTLTNTASTSDAIEDMMKPVTSKRLVFECQFAIHTHTTWTRRAS